VAHKVNLDFSLSFPWAGSFAVLGFVI